MGDVNRLVRYFGVPSLYIGICNSTMWLFYGLVVEKESSLSSTVGHVLIIISNFHTLMSVYAHNRQVKRGYYLGCFIVVCLLVMLTLAKWNFTVHPVIRIIFAIVAVGSHLLSHIWQIFDIVDSPSDKWSRYALGITLVPSFLLNLAAWWINNRWYPERVVQQISSATASLFVLAEAILMCLFKFPDDGVDVDLEMGRLARNWTRNAPYDTLIRSLPPSGFYLAQQAQPTVVAMHGAQTSTSAGLHHPFRSSLPVSDPRSGSSASDFSFHTPAVSVAQSRLSGSSFLEAALGLNGQKSSVPPHAVPGIPPFGLNTKSKRIKNHSSAPPQDPFAAANKEEAAAASKEEKEIASSKEEKAAAASKKEKAAAPKKEDKAARKKKKDKEEVAAAAKEEEDSPKKKRHVLVASSSGALCTSFSFLSRRSRSSH